MQSVIDFGKKIILEGKIPFFPVIKKIILFLSIVPVVGIFLLPEDYRNMGELSWNLLFFLLLLRPVGQIFVDFGILKALLGMRKELGILCGSLAIAHGIGYFLVNDISMPSGFFDAYIWDITGYYFWGMIGFCIAIILTITSNMFSMKLLKRWWKKLHRITYIFLFVVAVHIILIRYSKTGISVEMMKGISPIFILTFFWILSTYKMTFSFRKKIS